MSLFQPLIPTGTVPLNVDFQNLQKNFQQLDTTFGIDHTKFSTTLNNGYHKVIHMIPWSTIANPIAPPPAVGTIGELYVSQDNDGITGDETLYWQSGGGTGIVKMTRHFPPVAAIAGRTFIPGGLILQWGQVTGKSAAWPSGVQTTTFPLAYPTACYNVQFTLTAAGTPSSTGELAVNATNPGSFTWTFNGSSTATFTGFFWWAIGL